jgi:hypothetical protein
VFQMVTSGRVQACASGDQEKSIESKCGWSLGDVRPAEFSAPWRVVTTKLFLHTQVWWWHEAKFPDPPLDPSGPGRGVTLCFLDLGQSTRDGRTVYAAVTMVAAASVTMLDLI